MKYLRFIWDSVKLPLFLFGLFFIAGIGFSVGVAHSDAYNRLLNGKAIVITTVDLPKNVDNEEE